MTTFSELIQGRHFVLSGEINENTTSALVKWMGSWSYSDTPLTIVLTTCGGSVNAALAIHDALKSVSTVQPINIVTLGRCESAGNVVICAAPRERRYALYRRLDD